MSSKVKICIVDTLPRWTENEFLEAMKQLPDFLQLKIMLYEQSEERQIRVISKLLLKQLLIAFNLENEISIRQLQFKDNNQPYFPFSHFNFSTAHAGGKIVCAGIMDISIGVDIEPIQPINVALYQEYFTGKEWEYIHSSKDYIAAFYTLWVKKEALSKVTGMGVLMPFEEVEVLENNILKEDTAYFFHALEVGGNFIAQLATSAKIESIETYFYDCKEPIFKEMKTL